MASVWVRECRRAGSIQRSSVGVAVSVRGFQCVCVEIICISVNVTPELCVVSSGILFPLVRFSSIREAVAMTVGREKGAV